MLVTTVVAGGIAILRPFTAASRPFLRDIIFYMVAVYLTFNALYFGRVTLAWALSKQPQEGPGRVTPGLMEWEAQGARRGGHQGTESGLLWFQVTNPTRASLSKSKTHGSDNRKGRVQQEGCSGLSQLQILASSRAGMPTGHRGPSSIHTPFGWFRWCGWRDPEEASRDTEMCRHPGTRRSGGRSPPCLLPQPEVAKNGVPGAS